MDKDTIVVIVDKKYHKLEYEYMKITGSWVSKTACGISSLSHQLINTSYERMQKISEVLELPAKQPCKRCFTERNK